MAKKFIDHQMIIKEEEPASFDNLKLKRTQVNTPDQSAAAGGARGRLIDTRRQHSQVVPGIHVRPPGENTPHHGKSSMSPLTKSPARSPKNSPHASGRAPRSPRSPGQSRTSTPETKLSKAYELVDKIIDQPTALRIQKMVN